MPARTTFYNLALKEFNEGSNNFVFVKKGTEEYNKVKEIEKRLKDEAEVEKNKTKDNVK